MGCGSSTAVNNPVTSPAAQQAAPVPVAEDKATVNVQAARQAVKEQSAGADEGNNLAFASVSLVQPIDDPQRELELGTFRSTDRVVNKPQQQDEILTVCDEPDNGDATSPHAPQPVPAFGMRTSEEANTSEKVIVRQDSTKAASAAIVTLKGGQDKEIDALDSFDSLDSMDIEPPRFGKPGETILSLSDSDDSDEESAGFVMSRWKRYYHWNKKKPSDLIKFLWKRFDAKMWSIYCITYKHQDSMFAAFQGENVIHGLACRAGDLITARGPCEDLFGVLHTLVNYSGPTEEYKVMGVLIAKGGDKASGLPAEISEALAVDLEQWQLSKAEPRDPLVRQFVSGLITGQSPIQQFSIVATREIL